MSVEIMRADISSYHSGALELCSLLRCHAVSISPRGLIDSSDSGIRLLRNVGDYSVDVASHSRRYESSKSSVTKQILHNNQF